MTDPGFHLGMGFDEYLALEAANASTLKGFSRTPAHVYHELHSGGKTPTASMDLGTLLHLAVLEPERFASEVIVPPKVDRRYKEQKAQWNEWAAAHPADEWTYADADVFAKVKAMSSSLLSHPTAGPFFTGRGQNEITAVWEDLEQGVRCKARIDRVASVNEWPVVGDIKSTRDASRRSLERDIANFGYDVSAAHYLAGLEALSPVPAGNPFRRFFFFVVENVPPYLAAVYELQDDALEEGRIKRARYMRKWRKCVESGNWPGYPDGVEYISLPPWAFRNYVDE